MPGAPGDPGSALAPGGERPGGTTAPAAGAAARAAGPASGGSTTTNTTTNVPTSTSGESEAGKVGEATAARTDAPREEAESTAEPVASSAPSWAAAPSRTASASASSESASASASVPTAEPATAGVGGPVPGIAATATGTGGGGGASSREGDEPPGSRPKKPMLAAAGIVGAILIAVPFLLAGQDDRDPERTRTENAAGTVLDSERPPVPETYTSQSPVPSAKPSKKEEKKEKKEKPAGPVVHQQAATPSPSPSPEKPRVEKKPQPKPKPKVAALTPAEQLRQWANGRSGVQNTVIKNASTGQCVDIGGYGKGQINNAVNQYPCNGTTGDNQLWNLDIVDKDGGPQNAPLFLIRNSKDGLCLDLGYYNARSEGTKVAQFHCNASGDNQLWWLDPRGDGTNWIRNAVSNDLCLRPTGGASAGNDARLEIAPCGYGDHWIV
ncbi:RICIN domain-containing protein [Streptomyces sp. NPDC018007]|uniref:RICIN domain-containing protein n=1 Tax=Streptomyces sp. NPDC018007 TaxID=3365029 RepID=UPI0037B1F147